MQSQLCVCDSVHVWLHTTLSLPLVVCFWMFHITATFYILLSKQNVVRNSVAENTWLLLSIQMTVGRTLCSGYSGGWVRFTVSFTR